MSVLFYLQNANLTSPSSVAGSVTLQRIDNDPQKPFACCMDGCTDTFIQRKNAVKHVKEKHFNTNSPPPVTAPIPSRRRVFLPKGAEVVGEDEDEEEEDNENQRSQPPTPGSSAGGASLQ